MLVESRLWKTRGVAFPRLKHIYLKCSPKLLFLGSGCPHPLCDEEKREEETAKGIKNIAPLRTARSYIVSNKRLLVFFNGMEMPVVGIGSYRLIHH